MTTALLNNRASLANSSYKATGGLNDPLAKLSNTKPGDPLDVYGHALAKPAIPAPGPEIKPPTTMPDQAAIEADKKRSLSDQLARRGRASTILTDQNDKLGG